MPCWFDVTMTLVSGRGVGFWSKDIGRQIFPETRIFFPLTYREKSFTASFDRNKTKWNEMKWRDNKFCIFAFDQNFREVFLQGQVLLLNLEINWNEFECSECQSNFVDGGLADCEGSRNLDREVERSNPSAGKLYSTQNLGLCASYLNSTSIPNEKW